MMRVKASRQNSELAQSLIASVKQPYLPERKTSPADGGACFGGSCNSDAPTAKDMFLALKLHESIHSRNRTDLLLALHLAWSNTVSRGYFRPTLPNHGFDGTVF